MDSVLEEREEEQGDMVMVLFVLVGMVTLGTTT
jgi:hypothetical protein